MAVSAISLATNIILAHNRSESEQILNNQRLQRILFLYELHHIQRFNQRVTKDDFTVFKLGGVVLEVYSRYKIFYCEIHKPLYDYIVEEGPFRKQMIESAPLNEEQQTLLEQVVHNYRKESEWDLADLSIKLLAIYDYPRGVKLKNEELNTLAELLPPIQER